MSLVGVAAEKNISSVVANNKDMNREETLTLKAIVLYILKNGKTRASHTVYYIVKTAFVAQQKHLAKYLCPLFYDKIAALQFGPVPSGLYDALKIARGDANTMYFHRNDDLHLVYDSISFSDEIFTADENPDMNYLSSSAIECINEALEVVSSMSFEDIDNATHGNQRNRAYNNPGSKNMSYLAIAKEGGADESSISYLKENLELDCMLK